jgi:hypothetical protein
MDNYNQMPPQGYGQVPPQGYGQMPPQGYGQAPEPKKSAGLSIASMVLGIVALVFGCCVPVVTYICAIVGVILGAVALAKHAGGKGMAIAGLVCSIVALIPAIYITVVGASIWSEISSSL